MARPEKEEQEARYKCLSFLEAFRIIRPTMVMQHAYVFVLVAMDEGRGVQEYAERVGVTQPVMTRILLALGPRGQKGAAGHELVQQATDTGDLRKRQTFLTAKGKRLKRELVRLMRSDDHIGAPIGHRQSKSLAKTPR
jgi:DNA-binding MarR family transcriptional regulator